VSVPRCSVVVPVIPSHHKYIKALLEELSPARNKIAEIIFCASSQTEVSEQELLDITINSAFYGIVTIESTRERVTAGANRNIGWNRAKADYVCFLDADDSYNPHMFNIFEYYFENLGCDLILHDYFRFAPHFLLRKNRSLVKVKVIDSDVLLRNTFDGKNRRFILVQLPEVLKVDNPGQKVAREFCLSLNKPSLLTELTKERLRRAGKKIKDENPMFSGDMGFRVFKLDKSNIREWNPATENIAESLLAHNEHILEGRTEADIVYELLLKLGLDLCVPIESRAVVGKTIEAVGGGVLMLCLSEKMLTKEVEAIAAGIVAWHKELAPAGDSTVVFRDSAFADDVAKTNMAAILSQNGLENVRSL
jgi:adenine-specific DNA-methyltransferase